MELFCIHQSTFTRRLVEIYFYKGIDGTDASSVDNVRPTLKTGDKVQVISQ